MKDEKRRQMLWLCATLVAAAGLRIAVHNVSEYSKADERVYVENTRTLVVEGWRGYPGLVQRFLAEPSRWAYPPPLRWGYYALTAGVCQVDRDCNERSLAWLSTLAGIACVALTWLLGTRLLLSPRAGLVAAILSITSPLQLAMGRRALQDELFCAAVLLIFVAMLPMLSQTASRRRYAAAIAAIAFALSLKETALLLYPALVALVVVGIRRRGWMREDLALLILPPLIYFAGFALSAHSLGDFFRVASANLTSASSPYTTQFQSGPPHRIALDLFTLAPLVCLVAVAGMTLSRDDSTVRPLVLVILILAGIFSILPSKNLRFAIMLDPLLRILAAWTLPALVNARRVWLVLAANAACELALFHAIFIDGKVYDPVTANLLRALGAI